MNTTRLYLAGPMTGLPGLNFPAFHAAATELRTLGHTVVNPAEINPDHHMSWEACMRKDIAELVKCDRIHLLPGWESSRGATLEHHIAERLGLAITFVPVPQSELQRLRGEAKVLRALLRETTEVVATLIDDDATDGESACQLASLKDQCLAAIRGVPA
jgi:hypothetical protein